MAYGRWLRAGRLRHRPSAISRQPWIRGASELEAHRELDLPRRRVDVRQQLVHGAERQRSGIRDRRIEVGAVRDVEQLRDELHAMVLDAEELRQPQIEVREAGAPDVAAPYEAARRP